MKKITFTLFLLSATFTQLSAQNKVSDAEKSPSGYVRCFTPQMSENIQLRNSNLDLSKESFEKWLAPLLEEKKKSKKDESTEEVLVIPVVIHVVHNGDPINKIGEIHGENISYTQAASQIKVLNEDFRRLAGSRGAGVSGYELGVDTKIEFKLATIAPDGTPTNGVDRVYNSRTLWDSDSIDNYLKPITIWDPSKYLNIWSVQFTGGLLGYAQFPVQSGLPGLGYNSLPQTDGVVIGSTVFGTKDEDDGSFRIQDVYDYGRTATHEVGHWLGLRHIWGDGNCYADDYCEDTPNAAESHYTCNVIPETCDSKDMVENYMDYTNDECMNTFTPDQKARMRTVMENSPRRKELIEADVFGESEYSKDVAIKLLNSDVSQEEQSPCDISYKVIPKIEITNKSVEDLTSLKIVYGPSSSVTKEYTWEGNLKQFESISFNLPEVDENVFPGTNLFKANIVSVNGDTSFEKDYLDNNQSEYSYVVANQTVESYATNHFVLKLVTDWYPAETTWELRNRDEEVLYSGGPYNAQDKGITIEENFFLDDIGCYTFIIKDSENDGLCCDGKYEIYTEDGELVAFGTKFKDKETVPFTVSALSTTELDTNGFNIYPNPTDGILKLDYNFVNAKHDVTIYDMTGKVVFDVTTDKTTFDFSNFQKGVYVISVKDGDNTFTNKLVIK